MIGKGERLKNKEDGNGKGLRIKKIGKEKRLENKEDGKGKGSRKKKIGKGKVGELRR